MDKETIAAINIINKHAGIETPQYILNEFGQFTNYIEIAKEFIKKHPVYYDSGKNFWIWDDKKKYYIICDETDILNAIDHNTEHPSANSKIKNEILEALRRVGRKNKPKEFKKTWIQFKDKIIDLADGRIFDAVPEYFSTNPIPWNIGNSEETPIIDKLFTEWVGEKNKRVLYEILAFCLLSDYPIHRLFCLIGIGCNGKGTYLRLLEKFVGIDNICSSELDVLTKSRFESAKLFKKLVCLMGETNFNEISQTSIIKKLTGQDLFGFEFKNKNPFEDYNYAKIIMATNNLPETTDKTDGFYRRWLIIDFPNQFDEKKDIISGIPEEEFNNLACKSVNILKELIKTRQFHNEGSIIDRAKKYEEKSNPFEKFWKDRIMDDVQGHIFKFDFREVFNLWCNDNRFRAFSDKAIAERMKEKGICRGQHNFTNEFGEDKRYWVWLGISWKDMLSEPFGINAQHAQDAHAVLTPKSLCENDGRIGCATCATCAENEFEVKVEKLELSKEEVNNIISAESMQPCPLNQAQQASTKRNEVAS